MKNLSKSKIIAYRQCPKRLWLEIHRPELRDDTASEAVFRIGNQVGEIARSIYDPEGRGTTIDITKLGHSAALARSAELLLEGDTPVFEAGISTHGALAYADVMLPEKGEEGVSWKMIEVKASTFVKDYQRDDIAVQTYIATNAGVKIASVSLANINNEFIYQGDGNYVGLLWETDLTEEANSRADEVRQWIEGAQATAAFTEEPQIETGDHCGTPFACAFCNYCNRGKTWPEFPLSSLPRLHKNRQARIEAAGHDDLRDVPDEMLLELHRRIKKCSLTGETYFDAEGAAADLAPHGFPAYFLDFETVQFAVPIWKGTRPYQQLPFQFSLHILQENGTLTHHSFLDLTGEDPSEKFAETLISLCGNTGPVYVYNAGFERRIINEQATRFPQQAPDLQAIAARLVDLHPIAKNRFYHPSQHGSWSLKSVLPAAIPHLSYATLEGVQDGGAAVEAYQEAIRPDTSAERKVEIEEQLVSYCELDTFAMVELWKKFSGFSVKRE